MEGWRDPSLHPESCVWLGLGNKSTSVKVSERSWFHLNVNRYVVLRVIAHLYCIKPRPRSFPNLNRVLPVRKHNHKKLNNAVVSSSEYYTSRLDILVGKTPN